jgi:hypothetical protein
MDAQRVQTSCGGCRALLQGTEIHVEFTGAGRLTRRAAREFLGGLMRELGFLTTRVPRDDQVNARFVERMGFERTWEDDRFVYYMLTELPFSRKGD